MNLTEDQILTLAPDESSKKAGRELANPAKWPTKGADEQAIWGECQGSGSKPYQTQIDRTNIAFKCSCPSRKFPCKHGIALGLLYARQQSLFSESTMPAWVNEWISKRSQREEKKVEKKDKPVDEAAQAKRQLAREQKVSEGIEELLVWIRDIIRNGIISIPEKGYQYWDAVAKRMVDVQAPGLAGMVSGLANINYFKEGWQTHFLDAILNIYLIAKGFQNRASLDPLVLQDVRSWIGFTVSQEELKEERGVTDTWLVVGKQVSVEDNLTVEKNWLYGIHTNQYALVLQFIIRGQGAGILLSPGMCIDAELVYFPSVAPLRALIKQQTTVAVKMPDQMYNSWKEVADVETAICSRLPVRSERAYAVRELLPVQYNNAWWLKDRNDDVISIKDGFSKIWTLLALSGGKALNMVVVGKENSYEPVGVWDPQTYKAI